MWRDCLADDILKRFNFLFFILFYFFFSFIYLFIIIIFLQRKEGLKFMWNVCLADDILKKALIFQRKWCLKFHVNRLLVRRFTWNIKPYFFWKNKCRLLQLWIALNALDTPGIFSAIFYKRDNFYYFLLAFLHTESHLERGLRWMEIICFQ